MDVRENGAEFINLLDLPFCCSSRYCTCICWVLEGRRCRARLLLRLTV